MAGWGALTYPASLFQLAAHTAADTTTTALVFKQEAQ